MAPYIPRERKHRRLAKLASSTRTNPSAKTSNSNTETIIPETPSERDIRRSALSASLLAAQPVSKVTSKKRKRLDKYVDTKLKKEENLELLKKLARGRVDTSLLQSSKQLGRVQETKRERIGRALRERAAGVEGDDGGEGEGVLFQRRRVGAVEEVAEVEEGSEGEDGDVEEENGVSVREVPVVGVTAGSGLKRPLETDEAGRPILKTRKRRKKEKVQLASPESSGDDGSDAEDSEIDASQSDDDEWNGFDSETNGTEQSSKDDVGSGTSDDDNDDDNDDDDSASSEADSDASSTPSSASDKPARVSAFKQWADSQRNLAAEFTPSAIPSNEATARAQFVPRQPSPDPITTQLQSTSTSSSRVSRPSAALSIPRSETIQAARMELPVVQEEQKIMEAIHHHPVVIVCGATGSGKTTQVPQMLYEAGYGSFIGTHPGLGSTPPPPSASPSRGIIGVTQPRRVAAVSVAARVAEELGPQYSDRVAHQVRYDSNVGKATAIKFMTDGILLREISVDFVLSRYSAIVIDEAHERSVNTDILIGMLSRIVRLRASLALEQPGEFYELKLVIMSATLRVSDFAENKRLFSEAPPIVKAEGRQYPVVEHFARKTRREFVEEMVGKVARGHRKLPGGGVLVFLTSQADILAVAKGLKEKLEGGGGAGYGRLAGGGDDYEEEDEREVRGKNEYMEDEDEGDEESEDEDGITGLDGTDERDREFQVDNDDDNTPAATTTSKPALKPLILPLYAALPTTQQLRVFDPVPPTHRLIVLATNVAETSLTIPSIRYVFDCGRAKEKKYDPATGVQTFETSWISRASAAQRAGRAGRTGPGHVYRLYSSAVYERYFAEFAVPEILRTPLEGTVLMLKGMEVVNVGGFPFPTRPGEGEVERAEGLLRNLGLIEEGAGGGVTGMGREVGVFPVSPRFGKMLLLAVRNGVVGHAVALVAGLAVGELLVPEVQLPGFETGGGKLEEDEERDDRIARTAAESLAQTAQQARHQAYTRAHAKLARWDERSDAIKILTTVAAHAEAAAKGKASAGKFCAEFFLREKGMEEVQLLRSQLHNIVRAKYPEQAGGEAGVLALPTERERKVLSQIVAAGFLDQVAIRADLLKDDAVTTGRKPTRGIDVAYRTLVPSAEVDVTLDPAQQERARSVHVHASSVLARLTVSEMPAYIVYSHLSRATPSTADGGDGKVQRTRMHALTTLGPKQLAALAEGTPLLQVGGPVGKVEELRGGGRACWVGVSVRAPGGKEAEWPLGAWRVKQRKSRKGAWEVEEVIAR